MRAKRASTHRSPQGRPSPYFARLSMYHVLLTRQQPGEDRTSEHALPCRSSSTSFVASTSMKPAPMRRPRSCRPSVRPHISLRLVDLQSEVIEPAKQWLPRTLQDQPSVLDGRRGKDTSGLEDAKDLPQSLQWPFHHLKHGEACADVEGGIRELETVDGPLDERDVLDLLPLRELTRPGELGVVEIDTRDRSSRRRHADGDGAWPASDIEHSIPRPDGGEHEIRILTCAASLHEGFE